jgi:small GTP-binding protein
MTEGKYIIKLCLLGDGAVGKTSLVRRYVFDVFDDKYLMSFGTKVSKKTINVSGSEIDLMIWDILGQKSHESLHAAYYRGAAGALAVCDFTRPETMANLRSWIGSLRSVVGEMPVIVLGNKSDLEKRYSLKELESFGQSVGCSVLETSAKTGQNVELAFSEIGKKLLEAVH